MSDFNARRPWATEKKEHAPARYSSGNTSRSEAPYLWTLNRYSLSGPLRYSSFFPLRKRPSGVGVGGGWVGWGWPGPQMTRALCVCVCGGGSLSDGLAQSPGAVTHRGGEGGRGADTLHPMLRIRTPLGPVWHTPQW